MRQNGQVVHSSRHAIKEEGLGLILATMTVGCRHQLLGLRHRQSGVQVGEDWLQ